jgi:hypothetical protein
VAVKDIGWHPWIACTSGQRYFVKTVALIAKLKDFAEAFFDQIRLLQGVERIRAGREEVGAHAMTQADLSFPIRPWNVPPLSECPTYPANLCSIHCGGRVSHLRPRTTILHNESGYCKRFLWASDLRPRDPAETGLRGTLW